MPAHLYYVQLIADKTNAADLSSGVFAILYSATWMIKHTKFIAVPQMSTKTGNSDITKETLNCAASLHQLIKTADSVVGAISFIRHIVL